ncbi:DoxX family protein [Nocardia sp. NPDC050413]|uniref:DoxX family protein n=1 Tax=Nocardia sp. NPDC050413 TaxID=3155784 RepID=UPI0033C4552B
MSTLTIDPNTADRSERIRSFAYPATTFLIAFELVAGSVWNLLRIEWIDIQLAHLGYPDSLAYLLGAWQVGAAVVILAPGFPRAKEWAYAGAFFLWSGAVVVHLIEGDGIQSWGFPLTLTILAVVSWRTRPADRRLPGAPVEQPTREWTIAAALLVVLYAVSFLTLPAVEDFMHQNAIDLGWITE